MSRDMTKPTMWLCAQRRLRFCSTKTLWLESLLSAWRKLGSLATHSAHIEDSDQTGQMPRLIWVFAWRTLILLVLSYRGSNKIDSLFISLNFLSNFTCTNWCSLAIDWYSLSINWCSLANDWYSLSINWLSLAIDWYSLSANWCSLAINWCLLAINRHSPTILY